MNSRHPLEQHVGRLKTRVGACFPGQRAVFRGHDLHADLKDMSWLELYLFGITGRRFSAAQLRLLDAIWTYTSYPDTRLWNNRVAGLAGTARSTGHLGIAAALAVSEASIYGHGINVRAIDFLLRARRRLEAGKALDACVREELDRHRNMAGYGRPLTSGDERNEPIMVLARELGLADGPYVRLAYEIDDHLHRGRLRWRMNYSGLAAALAADLGLSTREYYLYLVPVFLAGMHPCFIEAADRPQGALFPTPCRDVAYEGRVRRTWPNAGNEYSVVPVTQST